MSKAMRGFLLNEAPEDEDVAEDIEEPTEENPEGGTVEDENDAEEEQENTEEEEESTEEEEDDEEQGDPTEGIGKADKVDKDEIKKYKLFEEYEDLMKVAEELQESLSTVDTEDFSKKEMGIFEKINTIISEDVEKLRFTMSESFKDFEYSRLLTIFLYLKVSITQTAKIAEKLIE